MDHAGMIACLRIANEVAKVAAAHGHHPFGSLLVGPDDTVLMRQGNLGTVRHAETELARRAAEAYRTDFLADCTMVTTFEPCAMCTGTLYWANIGTLVYGAAETTLLALTGNAAKNPTLNLDSRTVLSHGQKTIAVYGPFPELEEELIELHRDFWQ